MAHSPRAFDELSLSIIRAGGEGGFMEDALERVATFSEQQAELRARVSGALAYPVVLSVIGVLVVGGLLVFVVPSFKSMFASLETKGELPFVTTALMAFSEFAKGYGLYILAAVAIVVFALRSQINTPENRRRLDHLRLKMPGVSGIYMNLAVARFCRVFGTLLTGGVPIVRSLDIAADSTGNVVLADAVRDASENISSGQSLAEPLAASGHFPRNVTEMIAVAEQSNNLEVVLTQIADNLEKVTWRKLDIAVRLIEPLLLVVLATVVLIVVSALLLPVMKMSMAV
jgi:general secretion pathway protein F/type IV pilus assembly protein PilC